LAKPVFPSTFEAFLIEFRLKFIEENKQGHALIKLESHSYHMGSLDIFRYTDDFEDVIDLAGSEDPLVKVTKYWTGLDPAINLAITGSSNPLDLQDYAAWHLRAPRSQCWRYWPSPGRTRLCLHAPNHIEHGCDPTTESRCTSASSPDPNGRRLHLCPQSPLSRMLPMQ
jgi:hypothetical protein